VSPAVDWIIIIIKVEAEFHERFSPREKHALTFLIMEQSRQLPKSPLLNYLNESSFSKMSNNESSLAPTSTRPEVSSNWNKKKRRKSQIGGQCVKLDHLDLGFKDRKINWRIIKL